MGSQELDTTERLRFLSFIPTSMFPSTGMPFLLNTSVTLILLIFLSLRCYLWLPWVFTAAHVLSLVPNGSYSLVTRHVLFTAMAPLLQSTGSVVVHRA